MADDPTDGRFLSPSECRLLASRVASFRAGGGEGGVRIESSWVGHTRYTRNQLRSSGDVLRNDVTVVRDMEGAYAETQGNQIDDLNLLASVRRAERILRLTGTQTGGTIFQEHFPLAEALLRDSLDAVPLRDSSNAVVSGVDTAKRNAFIEQRRGANPGANRATEAMTKLGLSLTVQQPEPQDHPKLFFGSTYTMDPHRRADAITRLTQAASAKGMLASGYLELKARGRAVMDTWGRMMYYPATEARYTVTVRSPDGRGSGWAGIMWNDWQRVEPEALQAIALDKCLRSRNAVRIEPGRYTTILEPQAVHQLFWPVFEKMMDGINPVLKIDSRLTVDQDPADPVCASMPFDPYGNVYHRATWYDKGRLQRMPYNRTYAIAKYGENRGHLFSGAYRMQSTEPPADMNEIIATTQRGIIVTRFLMTGREAPDILHGYTRDGTWLVENGKISHAIENLRFRMSFIAAFNNVEQIGMPHRVYTPEYPDDPIQDYAAIVPALKIHDFAFVATSDAV